MQGGSRSQLSIDLSNVRADMKRGCTRGTVPRPFTEDEVERLRKREKSIIRKQIEAKEAQRAARTNIHTTQEANRVIEQVQESGRSANLFFAAINGSGSSEELFAQSKLLEMRAKLLAKEEKRTSTTVTNSVAEGKAAVAMRKVEETDKAEATHIARTKVVNEKALARAQEQERKAIEKARQVKEKAMSRKRPVADTPTIAIAEPVAETIAIAEPVAETIAESVAEGRPTNMAVTASVTTQQFTSTHSRQYNGRTRPSTQREEEEKRRKDKEWRRTEEETQQLFAQLDSRRACR